MIGWKIMTQKANISISFFFAILYKNRCFWLLHFLRFCVFVITLIDESSRGKWKGLYIYSLISIRQNYNFDMLATIWHEIVSWFLTISQDLHNMITKLFLFWFSWFFFFLQGQWTGISLYWLQFFYVPTT